MAQMGITNGELAFDYNSRRDLYLQQQTWHLPIEQPSSQGHTLGRHVSPIQTNVQAFQQSGMTDQQLLGDWRFQQSLPETQIDYTQQQEDYSTELRYNSTYGVPLHTSPVDLVPVTQSSSGNAMQIGPSYLQVSPALSSIPYNWEQLRSELVSFSTTDAGINLPSYHHYQHSPTGSSVEVSSLSSNDGWSTLEARRSLEMPARTVGIDPTQTLHNRALSDSSYSDFEQPAQFAGWEMVPHAVHSPATESTVDGEYLSMHNHRGSVDLTSNSSAAVSPTVLVRQIPIPTKKSSSPTRSPGSQGSSPGRKVQRKSPTAKATEKVIRKQPQYPKPESEKRVGRRKGPLRPDQRKQASEIRKLRACLRCKFLKKTCDKGEPCAGCQPSHARLWQVPCTRIDIKDIGFFCKDYKADYQRHVTLAFSVANIKGFSDAEQTLYITHGYGHMLPVKAREVYVRDESCFNLDWMEGNQGEAQDYEIATENLSAGAEGVQRLLVSDYLDLHIETPGSFERYVDDYFEGLPFLSQMLKTAYRHWLRTQLHVIKKALKLMLAYSLTVSLTMVEGVPNEQHFFGKIPNENSKFFGKTAAPVMVNFQVKQAMADMWRELQKDVLEELSSLYSSVYSGDKLKNWPNIFILATVLLAVWECMQFDSKFRMDDAAADRFCNEMESTPVGVIVGLFQAISQKLPSFMEWDTTRHHQLLASNPDVCHTMTEVREHVTRFGNLPHLICPELY